MTAVCASCQQPLCACPDLVFAGIVPIPGMQPSHRAAGNDGGASPTSASVTLASARSKARDDGSDQYSKFLSHGERNER